MKYRKKLFPILKKEKDTLVSPTNFISPPIKNNNLKEDKQDIINKARSDNSSFQLKKNIKPPTIDKIYQIINSNLIPINNEYYIKDNKESIDIIKDISKSNNILELKLIKNIKTNPKLQIILPSSR